MILVSLSFAPLSGWFEFEFGGRSALDECRQGLSARREADRGVDGNCHGAPLDHRRQGSHRSLLFKAVRGTARLSLRH